MIANNLLQIGIFLLMLGMILIFIASFTSITKQAKTNVKAAGGIFIGPFPLFGFASDKKMFYLLITLAVLVTIIYLIFNKF